MTTLRVAVASPDEGARARVAALVASLGHEPTPSLATQPEVLDACLQGQVDVAILDESLSPVRGSAIAAMLRDLRSPVVTVLIHRGEIWGENPPGALNLTRSEFDEELATVLGAAERRMER